MKGLNMHSAYLEEIEASIEKISQEEASKQLIFPFSQ
jgi:hypothetical protein